MAFSASSIGFAEPMPDCALMVAEAEPESLDTRYSQPE
jgi:hypothetical protein